MEIALSICRFDPEKDSGPFFQEYKVTVKSTQTVLDALMLAWQQDPSLSFRRSCRSAICGSCAMRINSRPALACQTLIAKATEDGETIVLEPLPHFRQLKDLVVDFDPFFESLKSAVPWIVLRNDYDGCMAPDIARELEDPATCILCGICRAECDDAGDIKPAGLIKTLRFARDPRDALGEHRLRLLEVPLEILRLFIRNLPEMCPKGITMREDVAGDVPDRDKGTKPA